MSIRSSYEAMGVKIYYKNHGNEYKNPHAHLLKHIVSDLLCDQVDHFKREALTMLDLSCGSGEGTVALLESFKALGIVCSDLTLDVSDPYTLHAFHEQRLMNPLPSYVTLRDSYAWSFEELSHSDSMLPSYDIVISSFALHLAQTCLFSLLYNLSLHSRILIVISPHKKPVISSASGWILVKKIQKRIHAWMYSSLNYDKLCD
jgi:hypothetical protein